MALTDELRVRARIVIAEKVDKYIINRILRCRRRSCLPHRANADCVLALTMQATLVIPEHCRRDYMYMDDVGMILS